MDAARNAVHKITGRTGHRTDVDESVNPAVVSETVKPHRHEETQEAVDREVHQDHYHTTVQPISHREQLPEKHTHNMAPKVEREVRQDNHAETQKRVSAELGQFKNTVSQQHTTHSTAAAPQVVGEHVHHHVHETVQPVIHKETYQPEVVHTTVPIHETHHHSAQHHGMSALPMKSLDEFKQSGGVITGGNTHTHEEYDGAPRPYNDKLKTSIEKVLPGHHGTSTSTSTHHDSGLPGRTHDRQDSGISGVGHQSNRRGNDYDNSSSNLRGNDYYDSQPSNKHGNSSSGKPSLMDKLNPNTDADHNGKKGVMN